MAYAHSSSSGLYLHVCASVYANYDSKVVATSRISGLRQLPLSASRVLVEMPNKCYFGRAINLKIGSEDTNSSQQVRKNGLKKIPERLVRLDLSHFCS